MSVDIDNGVFVYGHFSASDQIIFSYAHATRETPVVPQSTDELAQAAACLLASEGAEGLARFDAFPAPLFATDREGHLLYYNEACVALAGRTPEVGVDRWCICEKMHGLSGEKLSPEQGALAAALREGRALRDVEALVERADGETTQVYLFPTPAFAEDGRIVGAVNLFVPSDGRLHQELIATAQRCRTLAKWIGDRQANDALTRMAEECDEQALILAPSGPAALRN